MANGEYETGVRLARVEQRVSDLDARVTAMTAVTTRVIRLTERVEVLRRDLGTFAAQVAKRDDESEEREETARRERIASRRVLWSLTTAIVMGLIGTATAILTSVH